MKTFFAQKESIFLSFDKNACSVFYILFFGFVEFNCLATIEACVFYALTLVGAFFIIKIITKKENQTMKKILAFLLIVAMMFVVLCSCGSNGTDGTNGKDGIDGKSAYELAVENGFNGTVEEWLSSLVGEKGSEGKDGKTAEFRVNDYWLQWKYTDETVWNNICLVGIEKIPEGGAKVEFYLDGGAMPTG
ncbi:MAG: hypothetical protein J5832_00295, partial [Clostridia bacterium]|nr:hypothetical protein [Clostridia bacterium]